MNRIFTFLSVFALLAASGCRNDFLDVKPDTNIIQPETLDDFEGLLENTNILGSSALPTLSADEYEFLSYEIYQSARRAAERNAYIWNRDIFGGEIDAGDWSTPYECIFYANSVLAGLAKMTPSQNERDHFNFLKGWALFHRAFAYYDLVSNFAQAFDEASADNDPGVPLKTNPSIEDIQPRASVRRTYDLILSDLQQSAALLSAAPSANNRNRPSKTASYALMARVYLSMRKYDLAELQADSSLSLYNKLIDYNTVSQTSTTPFAITNDELIFRKTTTTDYTSINLSPGNRYYTISPALRQLYHADDLRPLIYFRRQNSGAYTMKMMYNGSTSLYSFTGLATGEVYLIKAECAVRRHDLSESLSFLNALLVKRYKKSSFVPFDTANEDVLLARILEERRKELIWRGLRWTDLKRLNKEGANITLTRELNGTRYTLPPNDPRYVFPIPDHEITRSGIPQNPR
ncbi:RagB/SusD family nutrient uptake outer membrane protein [Pararcticibacter amylolyticus]|uniref:RagB/SusD family nutrient uptake outer membrane protein n=1 Tax=Pararcticibacter amylolyticus TaxID=2173175 RepID=A0A2U2PHQ2_9SPHI|nr:RagB/SusD family nutrient uptake outer membrane protein [Pararcticibacter amylolyticus]PWG80669.1 hypothetical protein DDR33_11660 [Pararcticibacter amylolyticus]